MADEIENNIDSIPTTDSTPSDTPPEAQNGPINADTPATVNNENGATSPSEPPTSPEGSAGQAEEVKDEEVAKPEETPPASPEPEPESTQAPVFEPLPASKPTQKDLWKRFLDKVQFGKRKKLEKIMMMFTTPTSQGYGGTRQITNDEVEKLLHVSDKTAERYLNILEKENRIRQVGKTGRAVSYTQK